MLYQVVDFFDIKLDYNLNLMTKNQSLNKVLAVTLRMKRLKIVSDCAHCLGDSQ